MTKPNEPTFFLRDTAVMTADGKITAPVVVTEVAPTVVGTTEFEFGPDTATPFAEWDFAGPDAEMLDRPRNWGTLLIGTHEFLVLEQPKEIAPGVWNYECLYNSPVPPENAEWNRRCTITFRTQG